MGEASPNDAGVIEQLRKRIEEQDRALAEKDGEIAELKARVSRLEAKVTALLEKLEEQGRKGKRQAAPFSKGKRKAIRKKPGRKPGQGNFSRRLAPEPTEPAIFVPLDKKTCECGGCLVALRTDLVTITELPEIPKPKVTPYRVTVAECDGCGKTARGVHAEVADDQFGATAHRLGPRARAAAHLLHYDLGVPVRKTPEILRVLTGLRLTQGAITQDALRQMKGPVGAAYEDLREIVRYSDYVHTDDTGWRIDGKSAQLMAFETTGDDVPATVFQIRYRHRNEEVRELIPADYEGTMTTDRGSAYDAEELAGVKQNKCVSHIIRNIKKAQETQDPGALSFGNRLLEIIDSAMELRRSFHDDKISLKEYLSRAGPIKKKLAGQLRDRPLGDPANRRLQKGLKKQADRGHLLRFLEDPMIEPTNNRAERTLRPAVIARKVSHCSKNDAGAEAHAGFMSIVRTLRSRGMDMLEGLTDLLRGKPTLA